MCIRVASFCSTLLRILIITQHCINFNRFTSFVLLNADSLHQLTKQRPIKKKNRRQSRFEMATFVDHTDCISNYQIVVFYYINLFYIVYRLWFFRTYVLIPDPMREALDATNSIHQKMDWPVVTNWVDCSSDWAMQSTRPPTTIYSH